MNMQWLGYDWMKVFRIKSITSKCDEVRFCDLIRN